ncbi:MAG: hypothetical protein LQ342_005777 [Letrouitia transgressa]|nr:MAG: hypothetical protein LQ342_005777 [Letrouitia transgressa]
MLQTLSSVLFFFSLFSSIATIPLKKPPTPLQPRQYSWDWSDGTTQTQNSQTDGTGGGWPGWSSISTLFAFGASYTTEADGPNFVTYLTTLYNSSTITHHNFAFSGAKVDQKATATNSQGESSTNDLVHQISGPFSKFANPSTSSSSLGAGNTTTWTPSSTLFLSFFGINDVYGDDAYESDDFTSTKLDAVFSSYQTSLSALYDSGARNFLVINLPPLDLTPQFNADDDTTKTEAVKTAIEAFNGRVPDLLDQLRGAHGDASWQWYDLHELFERTIEDQGEAEMAEIGQAALTNVRERSPPGGEGNEGAEGYFWLNEIHPTRVVHQVLAKEIAGELGGAEWGER